MVEERRRNPRSTLTQEMLVYDSRNDAVVGRLADLSSDGLRVISDEPIFEGTELELRMPLPDGWSDLEELDFTAQCCWWEEDSTDEFNSGMQIVDITDTEAFVIREILDLYGELPTN